MKGAQGYGPWNIAEVVGHAKGEVGLEMTMSRYTGDQTLEAKAARFRHRGFLDQEDADGGQPPLQVQARDHRPHDLGLRLADVERLSLESESVAIDRDEDALARRLRINGALDPEIEFLLSGAAGSN